MDENFNSEAPQLDSLMLSIKSSLEHLE